MGREGGGKQGTQGPPSYRVWGEGEARATVLVLHTLEMHVNLSFSYLRFAEAASFDKKELCRSCTYVYFGFGSDQKFLILTDPDPPLRTSSGSVVGYNLH
jgi:hypothetical protein